MVNELKVYNSFGELTLHLRQLLSPNADLLTIDGTEDMRAAVAELRGSDFDRTIAKDSELIRLTANWGSAEFLPVLARYFGMNFGWRTQTIETDESVSQLETVTGAYGPLLFTFAPNRYRAPRMLSGEGSATGNTLIVITSVREYRPEWHARVEVQPVPKSTPVESERNVYAIAAP